MTTVLLLCALYACAHRVPVAEPVDAFEIVVRNETWTRASKFKSDDAIPVLLPRVVVPDPATQAKLDGLLTDEILTGSTRTQAEEDGWIDAVTWSLAWSGAGIVDLRVSVEGSGAYPDGFSNDFVLDVRQGTRLGVEQVQEGCQPALLDRLNRDVAARVAAVPGTPDDVIGIADLLSNARFTGLADFAVDDRGVVFHLDYGLPHVVAGAAPDGDFLVPWSDLASCVAPGAAMERLIR